MIHDTKPLQRQIIAELEQAMFHSLTTGELAQMLNVDARLVRKAAMKLRDDSQIGALKTNDKGRPEYRYFLLHVPVQQEISMEPAPAKEEPAEPWWRRVTGWFK
jgi:predicted transcriptional regulator